MNAKFLMYTKPNCPWCVKAKELLDDRHIIYRTIDISVLGPERELGLDRLKDYHWFTVPAIFDLDKNGELRDFIGGYRELVKELENRI